MPQRRAVICKHAVSRPESDKSRYANYPGEDKTTRKRRKPRRVRRDRRAAQLAPGPPREDRAAGERARVLQPAMGFRMGESVPRQVRNGAREQGKHDGV